MLRRKERSNVSIEGMQFEAQTADESDEMLEYVMALPQKYKTALYMHYYEDYPCENIAKAMGKSQGTIWNYLHVGRKFIKDMMEKADDERAVFAKTGRSG